MKSARSMLVAAINDASAEDVVKALESIGRGSVALSATFGSLAISVRHATWKRFAALEKTADDHVVMHRWGTADRAAIHGMKLNCGGCITCAQLQNAHSKAHRTEQRAWKRLENAYADEKKLHDKPCIAEKEPAE